MAGTTHRNHGRKIERQQQLELRGLAVFCGTRSASAPSPGRVQQGAVWCCLVPAAVCAPSPGRVQQVAACLLQGAACLQQGAACLQQGAACLLLGAVPSS
ncbi:hypothetical protein QL285_063203 [Trifolium repens]|nr:hypothetical protein QL285_063203 [Trifolium repens]